MDKSRVFDTETLNAVTITVMALCADTPVMSDMSWSDQRQEHARTTKYGLANVHHANEFDVAPLLCLPTARCLVSTEMSTDQFAPSVANEVMS